MQVSPPLLSCYLFEDLGLQELAQLSVCRSQGALLGRLTSLTSSSLREQVWGGGGGGGKRQERFRSTIKIRHPNYSAPLHRNRKIVSNFGKGIPRILSLIVT